MVFIGIDFSLTSAGVCIRENDKLTWLNFANNIKIDNKPFEHHRIIQEFDNVYIGNYERIVPKTDYSDICAYKLRNAVLLANTLIPELFVNIQNKESEVKIAFEGFAYGSKGNSFIDLILYNTIVKQKIKEFFGTDIITYAPTEIKKYFSGKGNAGKDLMFESFINSEDKILKDSKIRKYCQSLELKTDKKGKLIIPKPFDDLIDAYAISKKLYLETPGKT